MNPRLQLGLLIAVSMGIASLAATYRPPHSDEGWFSSASYNLANHGFMGTTVLGTEGTNLLRIDQRTYWVMPLFLVGQAVWYLFSPESLFWTRAFSILWVPVVILSVYLSLSVIFADRTIALLASVLLGLDYIFLENAGFARPELMCAGLGFGACAAYLALRDRSLNVALLTSHALIAASGLTHPNGMLFFAILCVLILSYDRQRISPHSLLVSVAPYLVFGMFYGLYVLQDPEAFIAQMRANTVGNSRWAGDWNPLLLLWREIRERYGPAYGFISPEPLAKFKAVALPVLVAPFVALLLQPRFRSHRGVRLCFLLWAVVFGVQMVFNQKLSYYLVHIIPLYSGLFAAWLIINVRERPALRPLFAIWVMFLVGVQAGGIVIKAAKRSDAGDLHSAVGFIQREVPDAELIVGSARLLYAFHFDPRLRDDPHLGTRSGKRPDVIVVESLYRDLYHGWQRTRSDEYQRTMERLSSYSKVYDKGGYTIYFPSGEDQR